MDRMYLKSIQPPIWLVCKSKEINYKCWSIQSQRTGFTYLGVLAYSSKYFWVKCYINFPDLWLRSKWVKAGMHDLVDGFLSKLIGMCCIDYVTVILWCFSMLWSECIDSVYTAHLLHVSTNGKQRQTIHFFITSRSPHVGAESN